MSNDNTLLSQRLSDTLEDYYDACTLLARALSLLTVEQRETIMGEANESTRINVSQELSKMKG